jgi:soluble lytic murein transglycosylase-like protein
MTSSLADVLQRIEQLAPQQQATAAPQTPVQGQGTSFANVLTAATTPAASTGAAAPYSADITAAGQRYGVDPLLLQSVIQQESGFDPNATSAAGAQGLMQLMPQTAASLGVTNSYDPAQSIDAGARYLSQQLGTFGGDTSLALAAYNAGSGAVQRYGGVPPYPETQSYVQQILDRYQNLTSEGSTT